MVRVIATRSTFADIWVSQSADSGGADPWRQVAGGEGADGLATAGSAADPRRGRAAPSGV